MCAVNVSTHISVSGCSVHVALNSLCNGHDAVHLLLLLHNSAHTVSCVCVFRSIG